MPFPVATIAFRFRHLLQHEQPMIKNTVQHGKTAAEAIKVFAGDVSTLLDAIGGLFGGTMPVGSSSPPDSQVVGHDPVEMQGWWRNRRQRHFIEHVKAKAQKEFRANGFTIAGEGESATIPGRSDFNINDVWDAASAAGAEELILEELGKIEGFSALASESMDAVGEGPILAWLGKVWTWIVEHQDQIMAVVKILLMFLAMLGIV